MSVLIVRIICNQKGNNISMAEKETTSATTEKKTTTKKPAAKKTTNTTTKKATDVARESTSENVSYEPLVECVNPTMVDVNETLLEDFLCESFEDCAWNNELPESVCEDDISSDTKTVGTKQKFEFRPKYTFGENNELYSGHYELTRASLNIVKAAKFVDAWQSFLDGNDDSGMADVVDLVTPYCVNRSFHMRQAELVLGYMMHYPCRYGVSFNSRTLCQLYIDMLEYFRQVMVKDLSTLDGWSVYFEDERETSIATLLVRMSVLEKCPWECSNGETTSEAILFLQTIMDEVMYKRFGFPDNLQ